MLLRRLLIAFLLLTGLLCNAQGQDLGQGIRSALPFREVSGLVTDSTGLGIPGAQVVLKYNQDSLRTVTDENGIFIFQKVKDASFVLSINSLGYKSFVARFKNNDTAPLLTLDPIKLEERVNLLKEVTVNGKPTIVYKKDTIEYKASDYQVRENATLDELLKKAEGFEVDNDNSLSHQGKEIKEIRLNGKIFANGNVAQAIHNLPADIVEKMQVIDDFGAQAARTGIKDGPSQKVLNVTTKIDKSVGNLARIATKVGNNKRFSSELFIQQLHLNREIGLTGTINNTITGVATSPGIGDNNGNDGVIMVSGIPGITKFASPAFSYRDQWSKNIEASGTYKYNFSDNQALKNSYGQRYTTLGISDFNTEGETNKKTKRHNASMEINIDLGKSNFFQINPTYNNADVATFSNSINEVRNEYSTGYEHVLDIGKSTNRIRSEETGMMALWVHTFKKARRLLSLQTSLQRDRLSSEGGTDKRYQFFGNASRDVLLQDSAVILNATQQNLNNVYEIAATFSEPLGKNSQFEFIGKFRRSNNSSESFQDTVSSIGFRRLSNFDQQYNYYTQQERLTLNYRFNVKEIDLSVGLTALPYKLIGLGNRGDVGNLEASQKVFRFVPSLNLFYRISSTQRIQIRYYGENQEADFRQLLPFTDRSDPRNLIIGNPDLRPAFIHTFAGSYDNYLSNQMLNISLNINTSYIEDKVALNIRQRMLPLAANQSNPINSRFTNINETYFVNLDGTKLFSANYSVSKQLDQRKFNLSLNGLIAFASTPSMSNGILYESSSWRLVERFGPKINPTENIEINPYIEYGVSRTTIKGIDAPKTSFGILRLAISGKMYFIKSMQFNYGFSKNFVSGIYRPNVNPFIVNLGYQKEFLKRHNLVATLNIYDLLKQNNFVQQEADAQAVVNTLSNSLSRYFLIGLKYNLQKWSSAPTREGKPIKRRGDGSFIN
ncbi:hypothetical protein ASU31_00700 [Pedobacter ginsenosidimutans]|uniref:Outer membrane protein beta-barrel domain-containing protein n=1 Tax=Pedobacter ginsenosidimutans TaxID=687842 RepID=A0A0T5VVF2_9SPHI|nr:TonB-dependent receptor [Pedobacter ginsenosidimutans]KRT17847.1 hypothetical protein ASU31_00700 [Pedobacter ginsenosidimutans]